jgi:hypothetical protein
MSGDHFEGIEYRLDQVAEEIEEVVRTNASTEVDSYGDPLGRHYSEQTLSRLAEAIEALRRAKAYARAVNYLLSGDDSEESFHKGLEEALERL